MHTITNLDGGTPGASIELVRNLATHGTFERPSASTVEMDRNRFVDPLPASTAPFVATRATFALSGGGVTMTATEASSSANTVRLNVNATAYRMPVTVGEQVELSADVASAQSVSGAFSILFYDGAGNFITGSSVSSAPFANTPTFVRRSMTATVPANAATAALYLGNGGVIAIGNTLTFRHIKFGVPGRAFFLPGAPSDLAMTATWTGATNNSPSILTGVLAATPLNGSAWSSDGTDTCIQSAAWVKSGTRSARMISTTAAANSYRYIVVSALPAGVYTIVIPVYLAAPQANPSAWSRTLEYRSDGVTMVRSDPFPNTAGAHEMRLTFTKTTSTGTHLLMLNQRVPRGDADLWLDDVTLVQGVYDGPAFHGGTPDLPDEDLFYDWTGTENASASIKRRQTWSVLNKTRPLAVAGYAADRESRNVIHDLLDGSIGVSFVPPRPRSGTLVTVYDSRAEAFAALAMYGAGKVFRYSNLDLPELGMDFALDGRLGVEQDEGDVDVWYVLVGYQEV